MNTSKCACVPGIPADHCLARREGSGFVYEGGGPSCECFRHHSREHFTEALTDYRHAVISAYYATLERKPDVVERREDEASSRGRVERIFDQMEVALDCADIPEPGEPPSD